MKYFIKNGVMIFWNLNHCVLDSDCINKLNVNYARPKMPIVSYIVQKKIEKHNKQFVRLLDPIVQLGPILLYSPLM